MCSSNTLWDLSTTFNIVFSCSCSALTTLFLDSMSESAISRYTSSNLWSRLSESLLSLDEKSWYCFIREATMSSLLYKPIFSSFFKFWQTLFISSSSPSIFVYKLWPLESISLILAACSEYSLILYSTSNSFCPKLFSTYSRWNLLSS